MIKYNLKDEELKRLRKICKQMNLRFPMIASRPALARRFLKAVSEESPF